MSVDKIIDELYEVLDHSWHLPLSGGKIIVDSKEIRCLVEELRLKLPKEIMQAKSIVENRSKVLEDTKLEAEKMMKASEEKIRSIASQSEIVKNAQLMANKIISEAKANAKEVKSAANQYVDGMMKEVEQVVLSGLSEIKKARQVLGNSERKKD